MSVRTLHHHLMGSRYRQGLGSQALPYANGGPGPSTLAHRQGNRPRSDAPSSDDEDAHDATPDVPIHMHVPPEGHGPLRLRALPPVFVRSSGAYDEEGRVRASRREERPGLGRRERLGGTIWSEVGWMDEVHKGAKVGQDKTPSTEPETSNGFAHRTSPGATTAKQPALPPHGSALSTPTTSPAIHAPIKPLLVPRSQWFIRKALLARAAADAQVQDCATDLSTSAGPSTASSSRAATPSLASLIDLPPLPSARVGQSAEAEADRGGAGHTATDSATASVAFRPPTWYAIPRDNVGYRMMVRGGWEGGGLGVPVGGTAGQGVPIDSVKLEVPGGSSPEMAVQHSASTFAAGFTADAPIELSDSDSDAESAALPPGRLGDDLLSAPSAPTSGPGRTAPIPTILKRAPTGIGYLPRRLVVSSSGAGGAAQRPRPTKRVTHTDADIRALKRGKVLGGDAVERGRKRVVRDAKREGRERQWIRSVLEA